MKKTIFLIGTAAIAASLLACGPEDESPEDPITGDGDAGTGGDGGADPNKPDADFVQGGLGQSSDGAWSGYTFSTAETATTTTIEPDSFPGSNLCVTGTMAAGYEEWALVGWNIAQELDPETMMGGDVNAIAPGSTGVNVKVRNNGGSGLRVQIQSDEDATESWCLNITGDDVDYPWSAFKKECWTSGGEVYDPATPIAQIAVQTYNGSDTMPTAFDYCVIHIGPY